MHNKTIIRFGFCDIQNSHGPSPYMTYLLNLFSLPLYYFSNIAGFSSDHDVTKMEGCPRSLMLNVDLKETFPTEFTPSLKTVKKDKLIDFI